MKRLLAVLLGLIACPAHAQTLGVRYLITAVSKSADRCAIARGSGAQGRSFRGSLWT